MHRTVIVLCFRGISTMFTLDCIRLQVPWTIDRLASKPYPGVGSTSGGL